MQDLESRGNRLQKDYERVIVRSTLVRIIHFIVSDKTRVYIKYY